MLGRELDGIEHAQHFIEVASRAHRVAEHQLDLLVRPDHKDRAHGGIGRGRAALGSVSGVGRQHVIELGDFELRVADHGILHLVALRLFDVRRPLAVVGHRVNAQPDDLGVAFRKFRLQTRHITEFSGAHGSEIFGMGKQDGPAIADPFVEFDGSLRGLGDKVRGSIIDA